MVEQRENGKYYVVREKKAKSSSKSTKPKSPQPSIDVPEDWSLQKSQEEDIEPLWEEEEDIKEWENLYKSRKSSGELSDRDYDQLEDQFLALDPSSQKKFRAQLKRDAKKDPSAADYIQNSQEIM